MPDRTDKEYSSIDFAKLAEKHPEKFQPLESSSQSIASPTKTTTGAALGAQQYRYDLAALLRVWNSDVYTAGLNLLQ